MSGRAVVMLVIVGLVVGCGSDDSDTTQAPSPEAEATTSTRAASIVGRWEVLRTCDGMVKALREAGLGKMAPSVVGDYFPDQDPTELGGKLTCARARNHSNTRISSPRTGSLARLTRTTSKWTTRRTTSWTGARFV
jgi:hypothetical protein